MPPPAPTPRTDAHCWRPSGGLDEWATADFARQIERELDAAKKPTPRTDNARDWIPSELAEFFEVHPELRGLVVNTAFARQLERALAAAQAELLIHKNNYEVAAANEQAAKADAARLRGAFGMSEAHPLLDVLSSLADAADHLFIAHDCDHLGWETWSANRARARDYIHIIRAALAPSDSPPAPIKCDSTGKHYVGSGELVKDSPPPSQPSVDPPPAEVWEALAEVGEVPTMSGGAEPSNKYAEAVEQVRAIVEDRAVKYKEDRDRWRALAGRLAETLEDSISKIRKFKWDVSPDLRKNVDAALADYNAAKEEPK